jgi:putative FmdB family regulatory protein
VENLCDTDEMPVFDFKCTACGRRSEHVLLSGESPPEQCSECGGALKRAWSGGRLVVNLEGWGFSRNDALIADRRGKDWKALKERAERIRDE